ncbi:hypothetical protein Bhyg_11352 [Pseudolycoriella hygida]|uniref:C2H2-type domain-containing protein n=1 Tax=Pseudolycoriella hygida TaxID=35572 RepID=A0A9Q0MX00_9DIPT|nr:hypothetical protein Bhyg_11352 [Pseudolycoriella hygida]
MMIVVTANFVAAANNLTKYKIFYFIFIHFDVEKSTKSAKNRSIKYCQLKICKANRQAPNTSAADYHFSAFQYVIAIATAIRKTAVKQRKASPQPSTSSAAVKESLVGKRKALPQSAESGGCQAIIRLTDVDVSSLGNKFKKQQKRFVCPFEGCRADFSSFLNLKNHFRKEHGQHDLQKPVDSETKNWRKIQNANSRYDMSTVKLKLRSLLVDGKSLVDDGNENQQQQK